MEEGAKREVYDLITRVWKFFKFYCDMNLKSDEVWEEITKRAEEEIAATNPKFQEYAKCLFAETMFELNREGKADVG